MGLGVLGMCRDGLTLVSKREVTFRTAGGQSVEDATRS